MCEGLGPGAESGGLTRLTRVLPWLPTIALLGSGLYGWFLSLNNAVSQIFFNEQVVLPYWQ